MLTNSLISWWEILNSNQRSPGLEASLPSVDLYEMIILNIEVREFCPRVLRSGTGAAMLFVQKYIKAKAHTFTAGQ